MKKLHYIYIILISALMITSCSKETGFDDLDRDMIAVSYSQKDFSLKVVNGTKSAVSIVAEDEGTAAEQEITNLYILMFDTEGSNPLKYFVDAGFSADEGEWVEADNKVKLRLTQAEAGTRNVYLVANVTDNMKNDLDGVTSVSELQTVLETTDEPWSDNLAAPILMSGVKENHSFVANRVLSSVTLVRAFAKVELNITLSERHQDVPEFTDSDNQTYTQYQYNFVNFDTETYVLKSSSKDGNTATSGWNSWQPENYILNEGKVSNLTLITYINETTAAGSYIELKLPSNDGGFLPPPEFGDETFKLPLPEKTERNNWYKYDVEL